MRGRPNLFTSYEAEQSLLPTWTQRTIAIVVVAAALLAPLGLVPGLGFLTEDPSWFRLLAVACIMGIAGLGLNLLTGVAGQVSLGHAFFMGVGAYTAIWLGGNETATQVGLDLPIWIWLPAAAIVPAAIGWLVSPAAVKTRGLYLAFVTLGLVFVGDHIFRNASSVTGGAGLGRDFQPLAIEVWREDPALFDFTVDWTILGRHVDELAISFAFLFILLVIAIIVHKNIVRGRVGRAFQALRDRDIAAEVMGVAEFRYKALAFATSSAFAGISGALFAVFVGRVIPETWDLLLSVNIIAIILIGGAGTTAGPVLGAFFVTLVPRLVEDGTEALARAAEHGNVLADIFIASGSDFGIVSTAANGPGLSIFQLNQVLFGLLIVLFLIFEPLGLYGIWIRIRNYWKGWPFTY